MGKIKPYDVLVFIGRFSPFHNGHLAVLEYGLEQANQVIMLVGSAQRSRSVKNPWHADERIKMITASLSEEQKKHIQCYPLRDFIYPKNAWFEEVKKIVANAVAPISLSSLKIGVIGRRKDASSYYLDVLNWDVVDVLHTPLLGATEIRDFYFSEHPGASCFLATSLPNDVSNVLEAFRLSSSYPWLQHQWNKDRLHLRPTISLAAVIKQDEKVILSRSVQQMTKEGVISPDGLISLPHHEWIWPNEGWRHINGHKTVQMWLAKSMGLSYQEMAKYIRDSYCVLLEDSSAGQSRYTWAVEITLDSSLNIDFCQEKPLCPVSQSEFQYLTVPIELAYRMPSHFLGDHFFILEHFLGIKND